LPEKTVACKGAIAAIDQVAARVCLKTIELYKRYISPLKPRVCRFYPTCSQYTYEAVQKYGFVKGVTMGVKRIMSCHPFNPGGYNPVE